MKTSIAILLLTSLVASFFVGSIYGKMFGLPFVKTHTDWSIGIYTGDSPFRLHEPERVKNPVLTIKDVNDANAQFLADPFLVHENNQWFVFFEVLNKDTNQGDIAYATSKDGFHWKYRQIVLDEPFHLSYPYVFKSGNVYYMIPEAYQTKSIRIYKADPFPAKWTYVKTLVQGRDFVDSAIFYHNDNWWILTSPTSNDKLWLYYSDSILGGWKEHPQSPVINNNKNISRLGGRVLDYNGGVFRFAQDAEPEYGIRVNAFEITKLTVDDYEEREISGNPIVKASGSGWNRYKMHQVDPQKISENQWIASVDGFGEVTIFGLGLK